MKSATEVNNKIGEIFNDYAASIRDGINTNLPAAKMVAAQELSKGLKAKIEILKWVLEINEKL